MGVGGPTPMRHIAVAAWQGSSSRGPPRLGRMTLTPWIATLFHSASDRLHAICRRPVLPSDERGQGMVEYALILVLIAVVVIVILTVVGNQVSNVFSNVSSGLGT
jgi:pilus assembly protein Flp/PilA